MEKTDWLWPGGVRYVYDEAAFRPGTDTFLLGAFPKLWRGARVCDLGAGIGLLGLLLLARRIDNDDRTHFAVMDVAAVRNAYGRQLGSFSATADFDGVGRVPAVFIRAPYIARTFGGARALASVDGRIVAARQGNMLATAFHPELSGDTSVHRYFLERIASPANRP